MFPDETTVLHLGLTKLDKTVELIAPKHCIERKYPSLAVFTIAFL